MKRGILLLILLLLSSAALAQDTIAYHLWYAAGESQVRISISVPLLIKAPVHFVVPRTYPGGYDQVPYDSFVDHVAAFSSEGAELAVHREADGPRWEIGDIGQDVKRVEYQVDVARMEAQIVWAEEASKIRPRYVGLLGASIFGYIDGLENRAAKLQIDAPDGWPVLSTLAPQVPAPTTTAQADAADYYALADSEILMGPDLQLRRLDGRIPLVLAAYVESSADISVEAKLARDALDRVQSYFGDKPFRQYTVQLELLHPLPGHNYGISQEHIDSGTFSLSVDDVATAQSSVEDQQWRLFGYAHHMTHSWIPKRAYGVGYRPITWEIPPVIDTIWFNEGFGQYAAIDAITAGMPLTDRVAFRNGQMSYFRKILDDAPTFIRDMRLDVLSREASFLYVADFRTGKNVYARGALMAAEMDDRIRQKTGGKKGLRDALRSVLAWSEKHQRAFQVEELMQVFSEATNVDVSDILKRWMNPLPK